MVHGRKTLETPTRRKPGPTPQALGSRIGGSRLSPRCLRVKGFLFGLVIGEVVHRSTVSLFDRAPFLRPDLVLRGRRAQPRSRLAAGHRRRRRAAALRAASTAPPLAGSGWPSGGGQRVSLERGPWRRASAGLASPYIRSSGT